MYIVLHGLASKLFGAAKIRLDIHLLEPPVNALHPARAHTWHVEKLQICVP